MTTVCALPIWFRAEFDLVRNAMFTLLGLMVGFAISMAVSRYDASLHGQGAEARLVTWCTEYLRLDLLSPTPCSTYVDERSCAFYRDARPQQTGEDRLHLAA